MLCFLTNFLNKHNNYKPQECKIRFLYCSYQIIDKTYQNRYSSICYFFEYSTIQYFLQLTRTIHKTARFELFKYFNIELTDIGYHAPGRDMREFSGILLPETPSGFPEGHKLVSFMVDPQFLLEQSYVLRTDKLIKH